MGSFLFSNYVEVIMCSNNGAQEITSNGGIVFIVEQTVGTVLMTKKWHNPISRNFLHDSLYKKKKRERESNLSFVS